MLELIKTDKNTKARRGTLTTPHGKIETPFFMPVATNGVLKSLTREDLLEIDAQIMLSNTYHLYLRPGLDVINNAGGLHKFANWDKPILTDSGGYQVFSLTKFRKITDEGVTFQSHLDGSSHLFTPESVVDIQLQLGVDMMMPLDVCAPYPCDRKEAEESVILTTEWAKRAKEHFNPQYAKENRALHFGIVQGSVYQDLREQSLKEIVDVGFDGYAIGGVSVGEPVIEMFKALKWVVPHLPLNHPRYFMGIGLPDQIVKAVREGIDMFDTCVPTRYGRHGTAFTRRGPINIKNAQYAKDLSPLDEQSDCFVSQNYSRSYIRHLMNAGEITGLKLLSYHNVHFYVNLMKDIRRAIDEDRYEEFEHDFLTEYGSELIETTV